MIADLNPYPAMTDSGVPWLGAVPKHWVVLPALAAYKPRLVKNTGMVEKTVLSLSYGRIIVKSPEKLRGLVPESFETYQIVDPGNIIIRTTDLQNDHTSLRIGHSLNRGIITSAYMCLETTDRVSNEFGYQFLNAYDVLKIIYGYGSGLRQNLDFSQIKRMPVLVPPKTEQAAIVQFLDHADRRIRRYVRAKQKLIKLLEEQKQAIIHRAVTRGLDPNVRLKPSGVEWLGDVPEHWKMVRLGRLIRLTTGFPFQSDGFSQTESDVRLLRGINVTPGRIRWDSVVRWPMNDAATLANFEMIPGDIVLGMDRPIISGGVRVAAITQEDTPSLLLQRVARIRPCEELNAKFALLLLSGRNFSDYLAPIFTGISVPHISPEQIGAFRLALPDVGEQMRIVYWVNETTAEIDSAINRTQREISLLREYRTRLIADVVTGKLDVRAAAANLPLKINEPESPDDTDSLAEGDDAKDGDLDAAPEEAVA